MLYVSNKLTFETEVPMHVLACDSGGLSDSCRGMVV